MTTIPLEQQKINRRRASTEAPSPYGPFPPRTKEGDYLHTGRISRALVLRRKGKGAMPDQLILELAAFQSLREH